MKGAVLVDLLLSCLSVTTGWFWEVKAEDGFFLTREGKLFFTRSRTKRFRSRVQVICQLKNDEWTFSPRDGGGGGGGRQFCFHCLFLKRQREDWIRVQVQLCGHPPITMDTDYRYENEMDPTHLWTKETPPVPVPGVSRFRRWLFPALMAAVLLVIIIVLGATNVRTSSRLGSAEQRVSHLSDAIQTLNASLQHVHETAEDVQRLQFAVQDNKDQLSSALEALKSLDKVDSLSKSVAAITCSLQHIINNSTSPGRCCPLQWTLYDSDCYFFSLDSLSWNESRNWCEQQNSHLVILHTDKEWDFVIRHSVPNFYWVGLSDWRTGKWEWVNQTPYTLERRRWAPGQPDNWSVHGHGTEDCAHLHNNGRLNDMFCTMKVRFICQKHSVHT